MSVKSLTKTTFALPMRKKRVEISKKNRRQIFDAKRNNEQKLYKKNVAQNENTATSEDNAEKVFFKRHQEIFKPVLAALTSIKQQNRIENPIAVLAVLASIKPDFLSKIYFGAITSLKNLLGHNSCIKIEFSCV